jgi:Zn-dependent peptidase ImmA (M78 family)
MGFPSCPPKIERLLKVFALAREVNHYYWVHTPDADNDSQIRIENLQIIIERMTRVPIRKGTIEFPGNIVRGVFERHPDFNLVGVRQDMTDLDKRFTATKEMCHALADEESEYSVEGVETIKQLASAQALTFDDEESDALTSERLAEILAIELLYPIELRHGDRREVYTDKSISLAELAEKRGIPAFWVAAALHEPYLDICQRCWNLVVGKVEFDPLKPL